jgi:hypothetical protein
MTNEYRSYSDGVYRMSKLLGPFAEIDIGDGTAFSTLTNYTSCIKMPEAGIITDLIIEMTEVVSSVSATPTVLLKNASAVVMATLTVPHATANLLVFGGAVLNATAANITFAKDDLLYLGIGVKGAGGTPSGKGKVTIMYREVFA